MSKQPLEPLIPLEEFGKLVGRIARVPKDAVTARKPVRSAPKRKPKPTRVTKKRRTG